MVPHESLTESQMVGIRGQSLCPPTQSQVVDKDAIAILRMPPPPLPLSWGRVVMPYEPQAPATPQAGTQVGPG